MSPDISIITPSFNMLGYLQHCCRSVADQDDARVEHLVIDGGSTDGTPAWLAQQPHLCFVSENDRGMYDAVNKGLAMANGNLVAYLNCDEQYLPGTLRFVADYFERRPRTDILFGSALLIRPDASLIAFRKAYPPRWYYILSSHLYVLSCTMFFRRRILDEGFRFNDQLRNIGDQDFVVRLLQHGYRAAVTERYLSAFTMTGANMGAHETTRHEQQRALDAASWWIRAFKIPLNAGRLIEKLTSGAYRQKRPLDYALYASTEDTERRLFSSSSASFRWKTA